MKKPFIEIVIAILHKLARLPCVKGAVLQRKTEGLFSLFDIPSVKIYDVATSPYTGEALV